MTSASDRHFDQARLNRSVAEELIRDHGGSPCYVQWAVTATFYCAVHCMQGYLVGLGHDPRTHQKRDELIADPLNKVPRDVYRAYVALKQLSNRARYRCGTFDPTWVQQSLIEGKLKTVTDFVRL